ncbi:MAG: hypothetical protein ACT4P5_10075 [Armatimonadota bacterium]
MPPTDIASPEPAPGRGRKKRLAYLPIAIVALFVAAFGAGYIARPMVMQGLSGAPLQTQDQRTQGGSAQDQQGQGKSPRASLPQDQQVSPDRPRSESERPSKGRADGAKGTVTGVIERVEGGRLTLRVQDARGGAVQQGSSLTVEVGQGVEILREVLPADLKKGDRVFLRGSMEGGRFIVQGIRIETQK